MGLREEKRHMKSHEEWVLLCDFEDTLERLGFVDYWPIAAMQKYVEKSGK